MDDSRKNGIVTFTGLLVDGPGWAELLHLWLEGRRKLTEVWGVLEQVELHANQLAKAGKGRFCETEAQERNFSGRAARARAVDILLHQLSRCENLTVTTLATRTKSSALAYARFIAHLDRRAGENATRVMVILDSQEGPIDTTELDGARVAQERDSAYRNAVHYRSVHQGLHLTGRRIIEDPVLHDSRWSQLIQAADLSAYAAYQHLWAERRMWPEGNRYGTANRSIARS